MVSTVDLGPCARRSFEGRRDTKSRWPEELYEKPSFAFGFELLFGRDRLRCRCRKGSCQYRGGCRNGPPRLETLVGDRDASKVSQPISDPRTGQSATFMPRLWCVGPEAEGLHCELNSCRRRRSLSLVRRRRRCRSLQCKLAFRRGRQDQARRRDRLNPHKARGGCQK